MRALLVDLALALVSAIRISFLAFALTTFLLWA